MTSRRGLRLGLPAVLFALSLVGAGTAWAGTPKVPYVDPSVAGSLALCDGSGHQVTSGSTLDLPLAWTAVSTVPAPKGYTDAASKATLYAYQPRNGVDPGDWSGSQLTGSSYFSNAAHPMAAFTTGDKRLHEVLQIYPASWAGFVQLRLFFSAPNKLTVTQTYPAANLQVSGTSWVQVDPPAASCGAGKAKSIEALYLPASKFPKPSKAAAATGTPGGSSTTSAGGSSDGTNAAGAQGPAAPSGGSTSAAILAGLLGAAAVGLGAVGIVWLRNSTPRKGSR